MSISTNTKREQNLTVVVVSSVGANQEGVVAVFFTLIARQGVVGIGGAGNIYRSRANLLKPQLCSHKNNALENH